MQLELFKPTEGQWLSVGARRVLLRFVGHPRARRYVLRVGRDGAARVTVPRRGNLDGARRFAEGHLGWLARQLDRWAAQPRLVREWRLGSCVLLGGEMVRIEQDGQEANGSVRLGAQRVAVRQCAGDLRPAIERQLRLLARKELPPLVMALAHQHGFPVSRVSVRNQRSRWGSCSRRGTISLNWRLIQFPAFVRDYLILHELAHLRHMNHSVRFWREVRSLTPAYAEAERWLKQHSDSLR